jgi:hypothetical protein
MDDKSFPSKTRRDLVPQKQTRALPKQSSVQVQLARLSQSGKVLADAIPAPVRSVSHHSIRFCGRAAAVLAVFAFVCVAAIYIRLLSGPISFAFLVPTLQGQLNSQIQGYGFRVGDAILRLSKGWGLEFRLADVSLLDQSGQELAKAPFAAVDVSEPSLLKFSLAASEINLLGPKVLVFNMPGTGFTLTASPGQANATATIANGSSWTTSQGSGFDPVSSASAAENSEPPEVAGIRQLARQALNAHPAVLPFNPAPLLSRLFNALEKRGGASSALQRIGLRDAVIYFASETGVSTWRVADFHINLDERSNESALRGELTLQHENTTWHASFRAVNQPQGKLYSLTASIQDIVPREIWHSFPKFSPLKLIDLPVSGEARFDISHEGELLRGDAEVKLGSGQFFAPFDDKHPATIDSGVLHAAYDRGSETLLIRPFELRWDESLLTMAGSIAHRVDPGTNQSIWAMDLDGKGTILSAPQFGAPPVALDALKISGSYQAATDTIMLKEFLVQAGGGGVAMSAQASAVSAGGPIVVNGTVSPMPISLLKVLWPAFIANGGRDWIGSNIPSGRISGGSFAVNLSAATLAQLDKGGDVPDSAVSVRLGLSGLQIYHIKGLPPIITKETVARVTGRRFTFDIPGDARIDVPSGRTISFSDGQLAIDDLRPRFPDAEVHFKGTGEVAGVLELIDQPPLGYVKAVGFKPNLINGQVSTIFKITFPLLKELKFKQMGLSGKSRVSELKSNGLPGGLIVNGGAVNFDVSETAIGANGDLRVNNVPVSLVWQRIFDAPPEKQPTLRIAGVLNEKARDELGLNINHIVKGDLPVALAVALQHDGPPKLFMEANLTNTDVFLTAIGWRKPPGQKASVTFDLSQRQDNFLVLDNFAMTGDGLNVTGRLLFNDKRHIAGFNFPEFSTNALTKLAITGELTPQNVLKVQARGPSYDGRQFFRSLLAAGKVSDNQPAPMKDEPGLDLNVEIETVFGYYDTTVKSVVIDAKRRGGKLSYLEVAGRLNGDAPVAVHVDHRGSDARILVSDATDAGSAFRLLGFYAAVRGGTMNLRVNLDGTGGADKTGILDVRRFEVAGDQIVGRVVSQAEREGARYKSDGRSVAQQVSSGEPLRFDRMTVPFSVGASQFQLHDAAINGPIIGATLRGRVDFSRDMIALSGTYVPLYGFNAVLGVVPLLGDLLKGRENEGVFGITFAVQGKTSNPDVVVNPVSVLAPGFLRQIFEFENSPAPAQAAPPPKPTAQVKGQRPGANSSSPESN